jgi:transcription initiation factor TFIIB
VNGVLGKNGEKMPLGYRVEIGVGGFEERPVLSVDKEIFRQASLLDLDDDIMHEAQSMYETARSRSLTKYKQDEKVITALLYVICRKRMIPLTLHKICDTLKTDYRSINKVYRYLVKKMGMHIPSTTPGEYVEKFAVDLHLSQKTLKRAQMIINEIKKTGNISGKGPAGVAAASICLASEEDIEASQKEMAELSGVTQVTIRNRCKELEECLNGNLRKLAAA